MAPARLDDLEARRSKAARAVREAAAHLCAITPVPSPSPAGHEEPATGGGVTSVQVSVSPEVASWVYANFGSEDRLCMLRTIGELKSLGVVSPAPFGKPEVDCLARLLGLHHHSVSGFGDSRSSSTIGSPAASSLFATGAHHLCFSN